MTVELRVADERDVPALSQFMLKQGQPRSSPEYLAHWYFGNPAGQGIVILAEAQGELVGVASANTHRFHGPSGSARVWMPQKVLTAADVRGRGIFGRLQRAVEELAVARGADFFLTVTNAASTPIFLSRFGYARAASPPTASVWAPRSPLVRRNRQRCAAPMPAALPAWTMAKTAEHHEWRFLRDPLDEYTSVPHERAGVVTGMVHLRIVHKRRVPVMLLLDVTAEDDRAVPDLVDHARSVAWQRRCVGLVSLVDARLEALRAALPRAVRLNARLNLLVKGLSPGDTERLAQDDYRLMFGDLDFV